jgi:hypothetical protein
MNGFEKTINRLVEAEELRDPKLRQFYLGYRARVMEWILADVPNVIERMDRVLNKYGARVAFVEKCEEGEVDLEGLVGWKIRILPGESPEDLIAELQSATEGVLFDEEEGEWIEWLFAIEFPKVI